MIRHLLAFFVQYGVFGLFLLAVADSSFLFIPIGNDLLVVLLVARNHNLWLPCVAAGAVGSMVGVYLLDLVCRKAGEGGLKHLMKPRLFAYLKRKMEKHAATALVISCIAPPPFPFEAAIAAASALQYPRARLLAVVVIARAVRFALVGWAAILFGSRILQIANSTQFQWTMAAFIALCVAGSVFSVTQWLRGGPRETAPAR